MIDLLSWPVTWGQVAVFAAVWLAWRVIRWWRRSIAWDHSADGGAMGRRLRAEQAQRRQRERVEVRRSTTPRRKRWQ